MIRAIDVSHYQGSVDWAGLFAKHNLDFGMAKCTQGTGFFDPYYVQNRDRVHALGAPFVAYHYATPSASSAATQARYFVGKAGQVDALCLDLEASSLNQAQTAAWKNAFGDALRQLSDVKTICYLGGYSQNGSGADADKHFDFWMYPRYASMNRATSWPTSVSPKIDANTTGFARPPAPHIWQWTANLGGMDASVSNLTLDQLFNREANMPTAQEVVDAMMASRLLNAVDGTSTARFDTFVTQTHKLATFSARDSAAALAILTGSDAAAQVAFFADLVAALPPGQGGAPITADEVATATAAKFAKLLGGTNG